MDTGTPKIIRIATRGTPLALWQADFVRQKLWRIFPDLSIELLPLSSCGDKNPATPLAQFGQEGIFTQTLTQAILDGQAEIAVHSIKDLPIGSIPGISLKVVGKREDPREAMVANHYPSIEALPKFATVGTSSLVRQAQLRALRPDLKLLPLRGNIAARLERLDHGEYDAIILAVAGLNRLGLKGRIRAYLPPRRLLPAVAQGALGIQYATQHPSLGSMVKQLVDRDTQICILAERTFAANLAKSGNLVGTAYARRRCERIYILAVVAHVQGPRISWGNKLVPIAQAETAAIDLAELLSIKSKL